MTLGMKAAISLPDDLFARADRLARAQKVSRSKLIQDALRHYLSLHERPLTDRINEGLAGAMHAEDQAVPPSWGDLEW